jgi:hypothetical protein
VLLQAPVHQQDHHEPCSPEKHLKTTSYDHSLN